MTDSANEPHNSPFAPYLQLAPQSQGIADYYFVDESEYIQELIQGITLLKPCQLATQDLATELVKVARGTQLNTLSVESFLQEFSLSTQEGVALMCLAEALIRIPDEQTADLFIRDRMTSGNWEKHLGHSKSFWINASTWGLMLSGKIFKPDEDAQNKALGNAIKKMGSPIAQKAIRQAMALMGGQFVAGTNIEEAFKNGYGERNAGYSHSYDMLGEAALTEKDSEYFITAYEKAIQFVGGQSEALKNQSAISIKLSALHPRYEPLQLSANSELTNRLKKLALLARSLDVALTIDAEETYRLESSLNIFAAVLQEPELAQWPKFGLAVQAYQPRAPYVIQWLQSLSERLNRVIPVRLVKGAYWDSEIKWAQQEGLSGYPVFSQKHHTDICYLHCAEQLLKQPQHFYPQFATHNAYSIAAIYGMAKQCQNSQYEFQRLHGMGEGIYDFCLEHLKRHDDSPIKCRIYAPVGKHAQLLPYLVRRLLENGANSSFVHDLNDESKPAEQLAKDPIAFAKENASGSMIPLPGQIYGDKRSNSEGLALGNLKTLHKVLVDMQPHLSSPSIKPNDSSNAPQSTPSFNPANKHDVVGIVNELDNESLMEQFDLALETYASWHATPVTERAQCLQKAADLMQQHLPELMALCVREAGKTVANAIGEVREAIDFCRYYASQAIETSTPQTMTGPTGESNQLYNTSRGVFLCISPWNFPVAIFTGQLSAALVTGNTVLAKPANTTPLIAQRVVQLFYEAGIPEGALRLCHCQGEQLQESILTQPQLAGVAFTGSTHTARQIQQAITFRHGPIIPFIAETGGQNAMFVDSTALTEQVVKDVVTSAFDSAGQRCSALRVLFLQEQIADEVISHLKGRMELLSTGDPQNLSVDIGPVIDATARHRISDHIHKMSISGYSIFQSPLAREVDQQGYFIPPTLIEIPDISVLQDEVFGPVLHVVRFDPEQIEDVVDQINSTGFGLTFGIHSRIEGRARRLAEQVNVGNVYVNRNMIGATVGVQPFGGCGLSGSGPKAGGPHYLQRFMTEKHICINTAAVGGNTQLLT